MIPIAASSGKRMDNTQVYRAEANTRMEEIKRLLPREEPLDAILFSIENSSSLLAEISETLSHQDRNGIGRFTNKVFLCMLAWVEFVNKYLQDQSPEKQWMDTWIDFRNRSKDEKLDWRTGRLRDPGLGGLCRGCHSA
jgi:hypothetical protein